MKSWKYGKKGQKPQIPYLHTGPCILINVLFGGNVENGWRGWGGFGHFRGSL